MNKTLRDVIRETTDQHLNAGYICAGQCLRAVGNVGGTLPERPDLVEFPMSDVAQSGFITGMALAGKRPIYVVRYQGFMWFNSAIIVNYAMKSKAIWGKPCPLLIRAISMEGGIGPVASSSHHSLFLRMPGVKIFSPMTPNEWKSAYEEFMAGDDVVYLSEHRAAWGNNEELPPIRPRQCASYLNKMVDPDIVLFPISITRFAAVAAAQALQEEEIDVAVHHISQIKPYGPLEESLADLSYSVHGGIVLDDDYPDGTAKALAFDLAQLTGAKMRVLGLDNRTAGFSAATDNLPPDVAKIKAFIRHIVKTV